MTHNPLVGGSSPPGPTIYKGFRGFSFLKSVNTCEHLLLCSQITFFAFHNWPKGVDRALSTKEVLLDPDTFGGKEDRLPYVEQAFKNAEEQIKK